MMHRGSGAISPELTEQVQRVVRVLRDHIFVGDEKRIQGRIETIFVEAGLGFEREFQLCERDRPDFFVGGRIVVEVKLKTPRSRVLRQLGRYAEHEKVEAIVLASPSFTTLQGMRLSIHGVPVYPAILHGAGLTI
ncbi:hypothetical protein [Mycobacteroides abscessus]|uniref:hypothetical protein n=1 Tax=Mycobacteroides abscessus TaxID=36809 RepID=UPI0009A619D3|nr:hypothetical protein [Mycobacteroides abscessus]SLC73459.1 Uncharacterised protein [Mycobacteroides abscessus subsp. massiliense]SLI83538.1 Uncharacterised protein [Mycobacteroides abscessus subsp. abscessus]